MDGYGTEGEIEPIPSFPRKREPRDFSHLPWAPAFAGATIGECCQFDYSRLRGDDEQGGVPHANFCNEVLVSLSS